MWDELFECGEGMTINDGDGDLTMWTETEAGDFKELWPIRGGTLLLLLLVVDFWPVELDVVDDWDEDVGEGFVGVIFTWVLSNLLKIWADRLVDEKSMSGLSDECEWLETVLLGREGGLIRPPSAVSCEYSALWFIKPGEGNGGAIVWWVGVVGLDFPPTPPLPPGLELSRL